MPTFLKLEDIERYGVPTEIDGAPLTLMQARVLVGIIGQIMDEAKHKLPVAIELGVGVFKRSYDLTEDGWVSKKVIKLAAGHGKSIRSKFHNLEDTMARKILKTSAMKYVEGDRSKKVVGGMVKDALKRLMDGKLKKGKKK